MKKRHVAITIIILVFLLIPMFSFASDTLSGQCGRLMTYSYDRDTKVLTVSGKGHPNTDFVFPDEIRQNAISIQFVDYSAEVLPPVSDFTSLTEITIPDSVNNLDYTPLAGCTSLKKVNFSNTPLYIRERFFAGCDSLETVELPSCVSIGESSFYDWTGLKHIEIPEGITHIGWFCFAYCSNLESITLPQSMVIESDDLNGAFYNCSKLKRIDLPLRTERISFDTFYGCTNLEEVLIPINVNSIELSAFTQCDKVVFVGAKDSFAERYAEEEGFPFKEHNHNYGDWTITEDATCNSDGTREKVCSGCGDTVTETIPALGHDYDSNNVCKRCGYKSGEYIIDENNIRIFGDTRYDTAKNVATKYREISGERFENVIVASGKNFPDALSGGYLAKVKNAPIFLVDSDLYGTREMARYIRNMMLDSDGTVYILGGTGAVREYFERYLNPHGYGNKIKVERLGGQTRFDTNLAILKEAGVKDEDILVCTGYGYADSLSASAVGKPILLVDKSLSDAQKEYIKGLNTKQFYLIGGEGVVGKKIQTDLKKLNSGYSVERLWGQSRYETSTAVAKKFFPKAKTVILAYAQNFPDGLSGGPLAMKKNAPIVLTDTRTTAAAKSYIKSAGAVQSITLGGPALISDAAVKAIMGR